MVNVIICDDNIKDRNNIQLIIKDFMIKNKIEYNLHIFEDYNKNFDNIITSKLPFKIYLLDIETPSRSGIDIAREIRRKDVDSVIIFLTGHEELGPTVLKNDLMFLSFINKFDNLEVRLINSLKKALKLLHQRRIIRINDRNTIYTINIDDILVIQDDLDMEVGKIKLKEKSSSGGHNGIKDIILKLGSRNFLRVKIGNLYEVGLVEKAITFLTLSKALKKEINKVIDVTSKTLELIFIDF